MARKIIIILGVSFCLAVSVPLSIAAEVKNVVPSQVGNRMVFDYELKGKEEAEVTVTITIDGKVYGEEQLHLEGDYRVVKPGKGKRIYWNVLQDFPRGFSGEIEWEITAGGSTWLEPFTGMEFVYVKGGCYEMGCVSWTSNCDDDEKPVHEVCVDDFWMGKYEVTQGQWKRVMGDNPSKFKSGDNYPVEKVSWNDVQNFIKRLNKKAGRSFSLPTEAEWEYACRSGGRKEKFAGTSDDSGLGTYVWYSKNSGGKTHSVGQKKPNGLGLFDMSGNVWEWVQDRYAKDSYKKHARNNPIYETSGGDRVLRGGSWRGRPRSVRCAVGAPPRAGLQELRPWLPPPEDGLVFGFLLFYLLSV